MAVGLWVSGFGAPGAQPERSPPKPLKGGVDGLSPRNHRSLR